MARKIEIKPCLWFDDKAEAAANYYCKIFPNSKVTDVSRYGEAGREIHGRQPGSIMTVEFELDGQPFTALNGGPDFKFSEAVSFQIHCKDQKEIDYYWDKLIAGGGSPQPCGWLKDKFGLSWQVVPEILPEMVADPKSESSQRAMNAMLKMQKIDIAELDRAYKGKSAA
jgi:predicted 3-demethylubiquinone-9 3-methyltransferase (glyoxalase superfamily)